jgi:DNA-binding PadR family transcriptional regulator
VYSVAKSSSPASRDPEAPTAPPWLRSRRASRGVGRDAYGVPVHDEIQQRAGRELTLGTIYKTLTRLEDKGLLVSRIGEPIAERGGRRTRCYAVTPAGKRSIQASPRTLQRMSAGVDIVEQQVVRHRALRNETTLSQNAGSF